MKKLLDREPTEEMIIAAVESAKSGASIEEILIATFDAAPEVKGAMSYIQIVPDKCDRIVWNGRYYHLPLKSHSEQLATLQAENERLWQIVEELRMNLSDLEFTSQNTKMFCAKLTAERDDLLKALKEILWLRHPSERSTSHSNIVETIAKKALAKHEGEKHD